MKASLLLAVLCAISTSAYAQAADDRPIRRVEVEAGWGVLSGAALGSADANLVANVQARQDYRLFGTESRFALAPAWHVRGAYALSRRFGVEGGVVVSHPELRSSLSNDVEGAPALTIVERVDQYFFEGSLVVMLDGLRVGSRTVPYAVAGAGYLRQLHEGRTVVEEGRVYHVGGGVKHWLLARGQGRIRGAGVRVDARLYLLASGISFGGSPRPHGALSASLFVSF